MHLIEFHEGDLVLIKILAIQKDHRGKWTPNYEGPYVVKKAFSGRALIPIRMDGEELSLPVNSNAVKNSMHDRGGKIRISTLFSSFFYFALFDKKYIIWIFIFLL